MWDFVNCDYQCIANDKNTFPAKSLFTPSPSLNQLAKSGNAFSKSELARIKRGGKGKHGFKSKARHKRR